MRSSGTSWLAHSVSHARSAFARIGMVDEALRAPDQFADIHLLVEDALPCFSLDTEVAWTRFAIITLRRMLTRDISVSLKTGDSQQLYPRSGSRSASSVKSQRSTRLAPNRRKEGVGSAALFVRTYSVATSWRMPAPWRCHRKRSLSF